MILMNIKKKTESSLKKDIEATMRERWYQEDNGIQCKDASYYTLHETTKYDALGQEKEQKRKLIN